jgi:hypothetical protein
VVFGYRTQLWSRHKVTYSPFAIPNTASSTLSQHFDMRLTRYVYGALFGLLSVPYVTSNPPYQETLLHHPSQGLVDESFSENTPAVGMDLTSCYGQVNNISLWKWLTVISTVVVAYSNGTKADVAKVQGSDAYTEVMRRLSLESSQHLR